MSESAVSTAHAAHHGFGTMIGMSPAMQRVFSLARKIASSNATTVLITGETGTGKDLLARELHMNSSRREEPFIEVNCSAIPETLLETELFGYEPGAFTDAKGRRRGLFELANGGTLFLDEIGYMTANLQVKLLKAIEEKRIRRVGGTRDIEVDIRIMAATNRNLEQAMRKGLFREDLYYRLNVISIELPPLRERGEDILLLARHFVNRFCAEHQKDPMILSPRCERFLLSHRWPGNVREMKNAIERAVVLGDSQIITPEDIRITIRHETTIASPDRASSNAIVLEVPETGIPLAEIEKRVVSQVLALTRWNKSKAARLLHIPRPRLLRKIVKYGLVPPPGGVAPSPFHPQTRTSSQEDAPSS